MAQTKEDIVSAKMNEKPTINGKVNLFIEETKKTFPGDKYKYKCLCCGAKFTSQNTNFNKTNDVLFQSNGGFLPWCRECEEKYVSQMTELYSGNEELAIRDFCQRAGWNYDLNALVASREAYSGHRDRHRILHYSSKKNINCGGRKTFIDTLKYEYDNRVDDVITSKEQIKAEEKSVSASAIDRWGVGFSEMDYKNLDEHYRMLKKNNPNADNNQEIFIKTLCNLNMLSIRALQAGDSKEYTSLTEQYAKTFKQAGLRTIEEKDSSNDETFCMTLGFISDYTPEEFYKDKELYKDFDKIGEYIERHITRPMMNLENGTNIRDKEFFVPEDDDYEE